jgi:hypothetical protein
MSSNPKPNPNVPAIPAPMADLGSLYSAVVALKEAVEDMSGTRGGKYDRAVTLQDLLDYGLVTQDVLTSPRGFVADQHARLYRTPANPAGTASLTPVMMGLANYVTPRSTGIIRIQVSGVFTNTVNGNGFKTQLFYGTGTAPVNGVAIPGSAVAIGAEQGLILPTAGDGGVFCCHGHIRGLTSGSTYWFDPNQYAVIGGAVAAQRITVTAEELPR